MEVTFKTKGGDVIWKPPAELVNAIRRVGEDPKKQAAAYKDFGPTVEMMARVFLAIAYGTGATPEQTVMFLREIEAGIQRVAKELLARKG